MKKIALMGALFGLLGQGYAAVATDRDVLDDSTTTDEVRRRRHSKRVSQQPIASRPQEVKTKSDSLKRLLASKGRK